MLPLPFVKLVDIIDDHIPVKPYLLFMTVRVLYIKKEQNKEWAKKKKCTKAKLWGKKELEAMCKSFWFIHEGGLCDVMWGVWCSACCAVDVLQLPLSSAALQCSYLQPLHIWPHTFKPFRQCHPHIYRAAGALFFFWGGMDFSNFIFPFRIAYSQQLIHSTVLPS